VEESPKFLVKTILSQFQLCAKPQKCKAKKTNKFERKQFLFSGKQLNGFLKVVALAKVKVEQTFCFNNQFEFF
jgi:hypothetical protein